MSELPDYETPEGWSPANTEQLAQADRNDIDKLAHADDLGAWNTENKQQKQEIKGLNRFIRDLLKSLKHLGKHTDDLSGRSGLDLQSWKGGAEGAKRLAGGGGGWVLLAAVAWTGGVMAPLVVGAGAAMDWQTWVTAKLNNAPGATFKPVTVEIRSEKRPLLLGLGIKGKYTIRQVREHEGQIYTKETILFAKNNGTFKAATTVYNPDGTQDTIENPEKKDPQEVIHRLTQIKAFLLSLQRQVVDQRSNTPQIKDVTLSSPINPDEFHNVVPDAPTYQ